MRNYHDDPNSGETEVSMTVYIPIPPPPVPAVLATFTCSLTPAPLNLLASASLPTAATGVVNPPSKPPPRIHRLYHRERALGSEQSRAVDPRVAGALERYLGGGAVGEARYGLEACSRLGIARVRVMTPGDEGAAG